MAIECYESGCKHHSTNFGEEGPFCDLDECINSNSESIKKPIRHSGFVKKGGGHEMIFATNDLYCGKLLNFKEGAKFSMHFHAVKDETWYVLSGEFCIKIIDTKDASISEHNLIYGDTLRITPLTPHQVICTKEGVLIEVSTPDSIEDNYRVAPGDSQKVRS